MIEESVEHFSLGEYNDQKRILHLESMISSTAYNKKKVSLKKVLDTFLESRSKTLISATPEDVRLFLMFKDKKGKNQVHELNCPFLGKYKKQNCFCLTRLASGTVSSLMGQLKSLFEDCGRQGEWTEFSL